MSTVAVVTAHKNDNETEEKAMSSDNLVVRNKLDIQQAEPGVRLEHVSEESLLKNGFKAIPSRGYTLAESAGTIYYVSPDCPACLAYIRSQGTFYVLDKDVVERRNYCALYVEHGYLRMCSVDEEGTPRNIHKQKFILDKIDLSDKEIDHIFINKQINTSDALRLVSHEVNVANTASNLTSRVRYYYGQSVIRLNFTISDDNQEAKELLRQYGFKPSRKANKQGKRTWISKDYDGYSSEAYDVLVEIEYKLYEAAMYSPFWDLSRAEGLDLYYSYEVLGIMTEEEVAEYNFDYYKNKMEEYKSKLKTLKLWDYQRDIQKEYEKYYTLYNYMHALYEKFGDDSWKKPRCAFN